MSLFAFAVLALISAGMAVAQTTGSEAIAATSGVAQSGDMPDNASIIGNYWRCCDGFAIGDSGNFELIRAPLNAIVTRNKWVCMLGLFRDGQTCERLMPPANGFTQSNEIKCANGFARQKDETCAQVTAPANAFLAGKGWCRRAGFAREGDGCIALVLSANG